METSPGFGNLVSLGPISFYPVSEYTPFWIIDRQTIVKSFIECLQAIALTLPPEIPFRSF